MDTQFCFLSGANCRIGAEIATAPLADSNQIAATCRKPAAGDVELRKLPGSTGRGTQGAGRDGAAADHRGRFYRRRAAGLPAAKRSVRMIQNKKENLYGLAFMEFIRPMPTWKDFQPDAIETFQKFRTPRVGEEMILEGNAFVEGVLPSATVRNTTDEEMSVYRTPFPTPESRRPTGDSQMNCRSPENRRMCIQLWRKHTVL